MSGVRVAARWLRPSSPAGVWAGVVVVGLGFSSILLGWSLVAGEAELEDQVAPFAGFGLGGLGLVVAGVAVLAVAVERRDGALRRRLLDDLLHPAPDEDEEAEP